MKQFYIYVHCRPATPQHPHGEPLYVGYSGNPQRCYEFTAPRRNSYHTRVITKHGKRNILIYTSNCESEYQAKVHEVWMIAWCKAQDYRITNLTDGGEGTSGLIRTVSEETKEKNRQAHLYVKHTPEWCEAISEKMLGKQNALGMKHTLEWRIAQSKRKRGNQYALGARYSRDPRSLEWRVAHATSMCDRIWITNGTITKMVKGKIPKGWRKGRK